MPACEIVLKKCELSKGILIQQNKKTLKTAENNDHKSRYVKKRRKNIQFVLLLLITLS